MKFSLHQKNDFDPLKHECMKRLNQIKDMEHSKVESSLSNMRVSSSLNQSTEICFCLLTTTAQNSAKLQLA